MKSEKAENAGLTQKVAANILDLDCLTMQNNKSGKGNPSKEKLDALVRLLKRNLQEISCPELVHSSHTLRYR